MPRAYPAPSPPWVSPADRPPPPRKPGRVVHERLLRARVRAPVRRHDPPAVVVLEALPQVRAGHVPVGVRVVPPADPLVQPVGGVLRDRVPRAAVLDALEPPEGVVDVRAALAVVGEVASLVGLQGEIGRAVVVRVAGLFERCHEFIERAETSRFVSTTCGLTDHKPIALPITLPCHFSDDTVRKDL